MQGLSSYNEVLCIALLISWFCFVFLGNVTNFERIYRFTNWPSHDSRALQCKEIYKDVFEILFEKTEKEYGGQCGAATLDNWYTVWSNILPGCKGMNDFPMWLRLMPRVLFSIIDRNDDNKIDLLELKNFFVDMLKVDFPDGEMDTWCKKSYDAMTDNDTYPLNLDGYELIFANFLISQTPNGPGKYIFGCFTYEDIPFTLIQHPEGGQL